MLAPTPWRPLARAQLTVMRIAAGVGGAMWLAATVGAELFAHAQIGWPLGIVSVPVLLLVLYSATLGASRRWRRWRYAFGEGELHVEHGLLVRVHTIVPVRRVQHIDVLQGPVERAFGVAQLAVHTAGTAHSLVTLPGLPREEAEAIRDAIRVEVGAEP